MFSLISQTCSDHSPLSNLILNLNLSVNQRITIKIKAFSNTSRFSRLPRNHSLACHLPPVFSLLFSINSSILLPSLLFFIPFLGGSFLLLFSLSKISLLSSLFRKNHFPPFLALSFTRSCQLDWPKIGILRVSSIA